MDGTDVILRLIGAFYVWAGYMASRAGLTAHVLDRALAALSAAQPGSVERAQTLWLLGSAILVLAGGVALVLLIDVAGWLFTASSLGQAVYLFWLAPRYFDIDDPPDERGRRQTTNAFVIYAVATAFVLWAASTGKLASWQDVSWPALALGAGAVAVHAGYVVWMYTRALATPGGGVAGAPALPSLPPDMPLDPSRLKRVKVMAEHDAHPLWALDEGVFGDFPPEALGLSPELARDLNGWAQAYSDMIDRADPASNGWTEAESRAHDAQARQLAARLKRERPDLMVYVTDRAAGIVEIQGEEG
ncbi:MAG: hypothetical protein IT536_13295 [Hyphomicrobiales bacterium]|nr:hypothetical protein [Hyphomicrobiales bacterium]